MTTENQDLTEQTINVILPFVMKKEDNKIITFVLGAVIIFTSGIFLGRFLSTGSVLGKKEVVKPEESPSVAAPVLAQPEVLGKSIDEAGGVGILPVKGDENAPVTIIEFSEYQCPFCGRYVQDTLPKIEKDYIETGKVKYYFRDFPLAFHQYAQKAAEAARCANEQGKFWEYHDKVFENSENLSLENLKKWAADLGFDTGQFNECLDSGKHEEAVKKDFADGQSAGVKGTPSFFINGKILTGAQPYEEFKKVIDEALGKG